MDTPRPQSNLNEAHSLPQTPVYLKAREDSVFPRDRSAYYVLARNGLYLCRNTDFLRSCVRAPDWPSELAEHRPFLQLNYPKLPRALIERVIGFFSLIGQNLGSEAAVLLAWDSSAQAVREIVPEQCGIVGQGYSGKPFPISLDYEVPPLPAGWRLIGDIHSHVDMPAFASSTDKDDEVHRPGLHLIAGRLHLEPPEFHCEVTVDGQRFQIADLSQVIEAYDRRQPDQVPADWLKKVRTQSTKSLYATPRSWS